VLLMSTACAADAQPKGRTTVRWPTLPLRALAPAGRRAAAPSVVAALPGWLSWLWPFGKGAAAKAAAPAAATAVTLIEPSLAFGIGTAVVLPIYFLMIVAPGAALVRGRARGLRARGAGAPGAWAKHAGATFLLPMRSTHTRTRLQVRVRVPSIRTHARTCTHA
jgi:hypothetical protein